LPKGQAAVYLWNTAPAWYIFREEADQLGLATSNFDREAISNDGRTSVDLVISMKFQMPSWILWSVIPDRHLSSDVLSRTHKVG
jgi:hypothetical protein